MIAIIDYKMGNLRSVENALKRLGAEFCVTADPVVIRSADRVLLPGVGNAVCCSKSSLVLTPFQLSLWELAKA